MIAERAHFKREDFAPPFTSRELVLMGCLKDKKDR